MIPCTPSLCKILRNTRNHKLQLTNRTPVIFRHKAAHTATRIRNSKTSSQLCCTTGDLADDIIHSCAILLCSRTVKQGVSQCLPHCCRLSAVLQPNQGVDASSVCSACSPFNRSFLW